MTFKVGDHVRITWYPGTSWHNQIGKVITVYEGSEVISV